MTAPLHLKFGGYQEPASIHNQAAARFGELLAGRLGDRARFELIGSILKIGRPSGDLVPMTERGELSFSYMSTVRFSGAAPELQILELPFVVKDRATVFRALDGALGRGAAEKIEQKMKVRVLGFWDNGFRHLTCRVKALRTPRDCRGIRIRTQLSDLHGEVFRALGFEPMQIDIKEFTEQIGGERIQAHDNPLTNIYNFGVHHHHKHITLSSHFWGASAFVCNTAHYRGWPEDVRAAVDEAAREATAYQRRLAAAEDAEMLRKFESTDAELIRLTDAERSAFMEAVQPVVDKYRKQLGPEVFAALGA